MTAVPTLERRNILRLGIAQALAGANATIVFATGAIVGNGLAPNPALATLPISIFVVGMALCTIPAGMLAQRHGRRAAFLAGSGCGVLAGVLAVPAVLLASFPLFCIATFFGGAYAAVAQSFRFAAADAAPPERRPRALSAVMAGGVFAGVLGPQLVTLTMNLWLPYLFAATFAAQAVVAILAGVILGGVRLPPIAAADGTSGRPLAEILRQPRFVGAVVTGAIAYMLMNLVMTAAPLAMKLCGLSQEDANLGLQWHVIAMYGPSFFTGALIARFGTPVIVFVGLLLIAGAAGVGLTGVAVAHFWIVLILLGLGWNFAFVGASALVLECHQPDERAKVQTLNDFLVFGLMAIGSFASGGILTHYGWAMVCWVTLPPTVLAVIALLATRGSQRTVATAA
ncbi:MFS transporter [Zavarzinia sp. CC-PAN008]|uniref:MFS transporter n=1 Tax=Zavarzinia sp. CC-PAN008 TaxID=3243332 RepID=UPI003F74947A